MNPEFLNFPDAPPPPPTAAYSHAVRSGDLLFVTGQLGVDPKTGALVPGGTVAQTRQVMHNLKTVLRRAGPDLQRRGMGRRHLTEPPRPPTPTAGATSPRAACPLGPRWASPRSRSAARWRSTSSSGPDRRCADA